MNRNLISLLKAKKNSFYDDPRSIAKKYDDFLATNGIYHSSNRILFEKDIKGHTELCEYILELYGEAQLDNERLALLEDLAVIGYNRNHLAELAIEAFYSENELTNLWEYGDLLYSLKNYNYLSQYIEIIRNKAFRSSRQMVVLLVGKSKQENVIPVLIDLLDDPTVQGHALDALSNFPGEHIGQIMNQYKNCKVAWIREIARNYLKKQS